MKFIFNFILLFDLFICFAFKTYVSVIVHLFMMMRYHYVIVIAL